jgi:acetate kinase
MRVLAVNAGSSSLKLRLLDHEDTVLADRELAVTGARIDKRALRRALDARLGEADAIGHRIVHGGERFHAPVRIDADVESALRDLSDLAPLHQPKSLAALDAITAALPRLPAVACFDTAFHATIPAAARTYALPPQWRERWGLRRFGFHGLSHAWVARRAPQLLDRDRASLRIVSCHLGAGASLCAISDGRSLDTTMGFTPLEGLVMATRSGSVDPGMLLWLQEHEGLSPSELADALEHRSGLLGLCGIADMRELLVRADSGDHPARLALGVYIHRLRAGIAAMAASLGGLDVLAFTGGVGERSAAVRERALAGLGFLEARIAPARNRAASASGKAGGRDDAGGPDADVSADRSPVATLVIAAREDLEIARQVRAVLGERAPAS